MKKKILFFGTPAIAVPSLEAIAKLEAYEIVGVGVFPDRPVGRKQILTPCPVKVAAQTLGLPVYELENKQDLIDLFNNVPCDVAIVIAFGMIFPAEVLTKPSLGVVNVHFSLLPAYRGASPVQSAILDGLEETGITWQRMVSALDAGDVLWQTHHAINQQTTAEVWHNFSHFTADAFPNFLAAYTSNQIKPKPQIESQASFCGKFTKQDGDLNTNTHTALEIFNTWRAFQPWPGVTLNLKNQRLKLIEVSLEAEADSVPIPCKDQTQLWVKTAQVPGKKAQLFKTIVPQ